MGAGSKFPGLDVVARRCAFMSHEMTDGPTHGVHHLGVFFSWPRFILGLAGAGGQVAPVCRFSGSFWGYI